MEDETTTQVSRRGVLKAVAVGGLVLAGGATSAAASATPELLYEFEPAAPPSFPGELPENVAVDKRGYKYVSVASLGEVWRFSPENDLVDAPFAAFRTNGTPLVGTIGLEVDPRRTLYAVFASDLNPAGADTNGVWTVDRHGERALFAELPPDDYAGPTFPNDLALFGDAVLVTDSFRGVVYRAWADGTAEVWAEHGLLEPVGITGFGANGIAVGTDGTVYVANLDRGSIVEIPVGNDRRAGTPRVFVRDPALFGADGLAFDARGDLYVAVNAQNAVRRVTSGGAVETVATNDGAFDGFDGPADVTFGTARGEQTAVFVPNLAFPSSGAGPSLVKLDVGVPGLPIHR